MFRHRFFIGPNHPELRTHPGKICPASCKSLRSCVAICMKFGPDKRWSELRRQHRVGKDAFFENTLIEHQHLLHFRSNDNRHHCRIRMQSSCSPSLNSVRIQRALARTDSTNSGCARMIRREANTVAATEGVKLAVYMSLLPTVMHQEIFDRLRSGQKPPIDPNVFGERTADQIHSVIQIKMGHSTSSARSNGSHSMGLIHRIWALNRSANSTNSGSGAISPVME